jgi:hypothetical protein
MSKKKSRPVFAPLQLLQPPLELNTIVREKNPKIELLIKSIEEKLHVLGSGSESESKYKIEKLITLTKLFFTDKLDNIKILTLYEKFVETLEILYATNNKEYEKYKLNTKYSDIIQETEYKEFLQKKEEEKEKKVFNSSTEIESGYESSQSNKSLSNRKNKNNKKTYCQDIKEPHYISKISQIELVKHDNESVPYELVIENTIYKSVINEKTVCKLLDSNFIIKKSKFKKDDITSIFVLCLEITVQNFVSNLPKTNGLEMLKVPLITNFFLNTINKQYNEIVMYMEYIETIPLNVSYLTKCIEILEILRNEYNIFHNDTHSDNVRQTDTNEIVLFDWGKTNFESIHPSSSGLYKNMDSNQFNEWLCASFLLKNGIYDTTTTKFKDLFGGNKPKQKQKPKRTQKYKSKRNSRKSKKLKKLQKIKIK